MSTPQFQVIARYFPQAGQTEAVLTLLGELAAASRTEPANRAYDFYRGVTNSDEIVILELDGVTSSDVPFGPHPGLAARRAS